MKFKLPLSSTYHEITATAIVIGLDHIFKDSAHTQKSTNSSNDPKTKSTITDSIKADTPKNDAYICWLKHAGNDVIGILPKWLVQSTPNTTKTNYNAHIQTYKRVQTDTVPQSDSCLSNVFRYAQSDDIISAKVQPSDTHPINDTFDTYKSLNLIINAYISSQNKTLHHAQSRQDLDNSGTNDCPKNNLNPTYTDGLMGYIGYDFAAQAIAKTVQYPATDYPQAFFGHYDIVFKRIDSAWYLIIDDNPEIIHFTKILIAQLNEALSNQPLHQLINSDNQSLQVCNITNQDKESYQSSFYKIQDYLKSGDCYQVNLAQQYTAEYSGNPTTLLPALEQKTNAPYAGYIAINGYHLISCSPELFIEFQKSDENTLIMQTKPIKGTMPRLEDEEADHKQIETLKNSQKNLSENLMIVDLLRNDFSVFAKTGSVDVPKLFAIESYPQVHHMVSTITAELSEQHSSLDVLMQSLPGGSITGAPKIRAIEVIRELEKKNRGAYCGSMGFINFDGNGSFNILIRTLQFYQNQLNVWAGGGITIASDADEEYQECLDKVSGILDVLKEYEKQ